MRQISLVVYVIVFVLFGLSNAYSLDNQSSIQAMPPAASGENESGISPNAANRSYATTPINKIERGVFNMLTFYLEIPATEVRLSKEKNNAFYGGTVGALQGLCTAFCRLLAGAYDTVTFIIPPYDKPWMEPEYSLDSWEEALDE